MRSAGGGSPSKPGSHRLGVVALVAAVIAWGLTWPVNKAILETLPPVWTMALRALLGTVALFGLALARRRLVPPPRADLPVLLTRCSSSPSC